MHYAARVRLAECVCNLNSNVEGLFQGQTGIDPFGQHSAFHKLHYNEALAFSFPDFVNCANVRMIQTGRGLSFLDETLSRIFVAEEVLLQEFDRYPPVELCVLCKIHLAHSASA